MANLETKVTLAIQMNHVEPFGFRGGRWFVGIVRIRPFQSAMDEFEAKASALTASINQADQNNKGGSVG